MQAKGELLCCDDEVEYGVGDGDAGAVGVVVETAYLRDEKYYCKDEEDAEVKISDV